MSRPTYHRRAVSDGRERTIYAKTNGSKTDVGWITWVSRRQKWFAYSRVTNERGDFDTLTEAREAIAKWADAWFVDCAKAILAEGTR